MDSRPVRRAGARAAGRSRWSAWARAAWRRRCCSGERGIPVYASDTGTGARLRRAGPRDAASCRCRGQIWAATISRASPVPRPWSWRRAYRPTCRRSRPRGAPGSRSTPRWTSGFVALRGDSLRRHHRDQRQDHDDVAHRACAGDGRPPGRDGREHRAAAVRGGAGRATRRTGWRSSSRSFQLHDAPNLKPAIGVLTNLAPNHLDRYHTLEEYYGDKALLFRNADAGLGLGHQRG